MINYWKNSKDIKDYIYIPKFYNPDIEKELKKLEGTNTLKSIKNLVDENLLSISTGDEIGKMAYGTGSIPFIRTSDITNWELKATPKQGISEQIYNKYASKQDNKFR